MFLVFLRKLRIVTAGIKNIKTKAKVKNGVKSAKPYLKYYTFENPKEQSVDN
jgi:hypothetical protein